MQEILRSCVQWLRTPSSTFEKAEMASPPQDVLWSSIWHLLESIFQDVGVDELLMSSGHVGVVYGDGRREARASPFTNDDLYGAMQDLAFSQHLRLDPVVPSAGGMLEGGAYRWHGLLPPLSAQGPLLSIRRHRLQRLDLGDFSWSEPGDRDRLCDIARGHMPMVIYGATGAGKTTLAVALLKAVAQGERVVILESLQEWPLLSPQWVGLYARPANLTGHGAITMRQLLHEALRMRPDRIIVGETRMDEGSVFIEAAMTGHRAGITTMHAGSAEEALARLRVQTGDTLPSGIKEICCIGVASHAGGKYVTIDIRRI